jgi:biopolymer transport protein ExbB/TolQ
MQQENARETTRLRVPTWMLGTLFSVVVSVVGIGIKVWSNTNLHEEQIAILSRDSDRYATQIETLKTELHQANVKIARIEREQDELLDAANEKLDALLDASKGRRR